jgi:CheY-like chemotaxis protein
MVTGTAAALGQEVAIAGDMAEAVELCRARPPAYVIIDLGIAEIDIEAAVARLREAAGAVPTIAYGSHVDKARLDAARAAGCDEVLPRSRFSAELPALLRRCFDGRPKD